MRHAATILGAVMLGWLLFPGCGHHSVNNGFGGEPGAGGGTTTSASGGCLSSTDCPTNGSYYCQLPGDTCPKCFFKNPMCTTNGDCATGQACGLCKTCVPSCVANPSACGTGKVCDPTSQECVTACQSASSCPTNFTCNQGMCVQKTCSADTDCSGFCAGGVCVSQRGTCVECM